MNKLALTLDQYSNNKNHFLKVLFTFESDLNRDSVR